MRKITFMWFIQNYSYCWHKKGEALESPTFFAEMMQQTSWELHLYPKGNEDPDFIALYLKRSDNCNGPEAVALNYELSILDANGKVLETVESKEFQFEMPKSARFGLSDFLERPEDQADRTLDMLRVRCTMLMGEGEIDKEALSYAETRIGLQKISFNHTIEKFAVLEPNRKIPFDATSVSEDRLNLSGNVYIKSEPDSKDEVMMEIFLNSEDGRLTTCQMYILNSAGKEVECGKIDTRKEKYNGNTLSTQIKLENENLLERKDEYFPNGKLTLRCECTLSTGIEFQGIEETFHDLHLTPLLKKRLNNEYFATFTAEPKTVEGDLRFLLQDQVLSDIELRTESKTFPAHKSILCVRSPVFGQMFNTDMKEKLLDCVQVVDLEDSTIDQFLLFLYTDILEDFDWESIKKLYYAADKYGVQRLKDVCNSFLLSELNCRNMGDLLILADRHQDIYLKRAVDKFICRRDKKIFFTDEWESFMDTNPELAIKAVHFYLKNRRE